MTHNTPFSTLPQSVAATSLVLLLTACGADDASSKTSDASEECSGHGHLHDDHCDCDDGYEPDADDATRCVPSQGTPHGTDTPHGTHMLAGRLLVSDGKDGHVVVVDLEQGKAIASLSVDGAARVYASSDGLRGFAVQGAEDLVQGIDPGLRYESHGDHFDVETTKPSVLSEIIVSCARPVHFVAHEGHAAAFCDGDGMLHVFEDSVGSGSLDVRSHDSGRAHHGVGLVALGRVLLSIPNPDDDEDALPVGVRALALDGTEEDVFDDCAGLHGEAASEDHVCFGCSDGVLCVAETADGDLENIKIQNPEDSEEGVRVGTLAAKGDVLVGNWGEDLVRIDPRNESLSPMSLGEAYLTFALTDDAKHVLVLADSGRLHKLRVRDGKTLASVELLPKFVRESGHGQLRPSLVVGPEHAYVVDPRHPEIYELDVESLELTERTIELDEGEYHSLALVALPPE